MLRIYSWNLILRGAAVFFAAGPSRVFASCCFGDQFATEFELVEPLRLDINIIIGGPKEDKPPMGPPMGPPMPPPGRPPIPPGAMGAMQPPGMGGGPAGAGGSPPGMPPGGMPPR